MHDDDVVDLCGDEAQREECRKDNACDVEVKDHDEGILVGTLLVCLVFVAERDGLCE